MASLTSLTVLANLLVLSLLLISNVPCTDSTQSIDLVSCSGRLLLLAPCTGFVQGATPAPNNACCSNLISIYHSQPACFCPLIDGSFALPMNHSLILQLPRLCGFNLTGIANICPLVALPPMGSPQPHSSIRSNGSSSPAGSEDLIHAKPRRVNNLPMKNAGSGKQIRAREAAFVMVSSVLALIQHMVFWE